MYQSNFCPTTFNYTTSFKHVVNSAHNEFTVSFVPVGVKPEDGMERNSQAPPPILLFVAFLCLGIVVGFFFAKRRNNKLIKK